MAAGVQFDETTDVVVAGYGFAGAAAAIAAADAGKRVLLLEKMAVPGGISICSGGGMRVATDAHKALAYLRATNAGSIPDELLAAFAVELTRLPAELAALAAINGAKLTTLERPASYALPGHDAFQFIEVESVPDFDARKEYPNATSLRAGINAFKVLEDNVRARPRIEVRLSAPVGRLLRGDAGEILGVEAGTASGTRRIGTRHGVILACGGFESDPVMQRQFWQFHPVLPASTRGNTGDGIRMAQALGADIWHMWHFHGSYGFRHTDPAYVFGMRTKKLPDWVPGLPSAPVRMSWILVDQTGRRFMNEYEPYAHDTGHRAFDRFDPTTSRFPAMPAYLVFDEAGRKMYPVAKSFINDAEISNYEWSDDNLREVGLGILKRAESIAGLARLMKLPEAVLAETVARWNRLCAEGGVDELGRPAATRVPLGSPPYYFGEVWPVVSNTQGGLVHDVAQRVHNPFGEAIPRLYVAGELGSIWGFLYLAGGNLAECFISGRIAGANAAAEPRLAQ
jgi:succinate dehydrogenase/fumarate reductase flavoprotein subunit